MPDINENPYYTPGRISWSEEKIEQSHESGLVLAEQLQDGETDLIPDAVIGFLTQHSLAINSRAVGEMRKQIADSMVVPHTLEQTQNVASGIIDLIAKSDESFIQFTMTEIEVMGQMNVIAKQFGLNTDI